MASNEQLVQVNGVGLCAETFGNPADPAILLIMGAGGSMLSWHEGFCERLAAGERFVIRYDNRDTGRSVAYEPGAVASLTLISSSPGLDPDLPPILEELRRHFSAPAAEPDWSDRQAVIDYIVEDARWYSAKSCPFDEEAWRELAGRDFDRSVSIESSMTNHFVIEGGDRWRERLGEISAPTLVIHGTEDPLFPIGHGQALANEIPGARLLALERTGHELPWTVWDKVVPAILQHTSSG